MKSVIRWRSLKVRAGVIELQVRVVVRELPGDLKVVDLSADFRLEDVDTYAEWYGHEHRAPHLQDSAVYGLSEWARDALAEARLAALQSEQRSP